MNSKQYQMNKWKVLFVFFLTVNNLFSQQNGYYGRKLFLEIDGQGQFPVLQTLFGEDKGFVIRKDKLKNTVNWVDVAFRASVSYTFTKRFAFGFEYSQRFYQFNPQSQHEIARDYRNIYGDLVSEYLPAKVPLFGLNESVFMPRMLFSLNDAQIPCGFASEWGIGYALVNVPRNNSKIMLDEGYKEYTSEVLEKFLDPKAKNFSGINFMFGFRMNFPVTKRILFHVGMRYQYAMLLGKQKYRSMNESEYWFSPREIWSKVSLRRQFGVISIGTGLTFSF